MMGCQTRDLLLLAASTLGLEHLGYDPVANALRRHKPAAVWNPLASWDQAMDLVVHLGLNLNVSDHIKYTWVKHPFLREPVVVPHGDDPVLATCYAVVQAATTYGLLPMPRKDLH